MHCLGAVVGGNASPNGVGNCGGVVSVVRALGVLLSEGRIQGLPRGYKEGPHCAAPLQVTSNGHKCEKDNYLCDRYLILIREISDRIAIGTFLCVEVLLCTDCPCGLAKATSKDPIFSIPSISISPWQQSTEILLEYWCISVVKSKGPEMMNSQGLYQAVRSRLHFSQVAAWWSRSKGSKPSYVATRVVPYNEDSLRKFRESPSEHTFPLAGSGDGNSIKVTVWALPRMEDVPILICPIHPNADKDGEGGARALTPTKNIPVSTVSQKPETLVLPALVDDRLHTPCTEPGKHHCRCEEEDGCPPSPSVRPNGERKRRRSLPCGPADVDSCSLYHPIVLLSVQESAGKESNGHCVKDSDSSGVDQSSDHPRYPERSSYHDRALEMEQDHLVQQIDKNGCEIQTNLNSLERCFSRQLSIEEQEGNVEKRYKRTIENTNGEKEKSFCRRREKSPKFGQKASNSSCNWEGIYDRTENVSSMKNEDFDEFASFDTSMFLSSSGTTSWKNGSAGSVENVHNRKKGFVNDTIRNTMPPVPRETNLVINPFRERSPFHEANPGPSTYSLGHIESKSHLISPACAVHQSCRISPSSESTDRSLLGRDMQLESSEKIVDARRHLTTGKDLSRLMSKLTFPEEKVETKEEGGILDWISKVPGRVLSAATNNGLVEKRSKTSDSSCRSAPSNEAKLKNCNLELSQREFDEVLAVLRARTPSGRKRTPLRMIKKRDRVERSTDEAIVDKNSSRSTSVNLNDCRYPTHYEDDRTVASYEECDCRFCKRSYHRPLRRLGSTKSDSCNESTQYQSRSTLQSREKVASCRLTKDDCLETGRLDQLEKRTNKSADCFYNVSNKADLLLEAILRTSRERKGLADISNETRPRSALPIAKSENTSNLRGSTKIEQQTNQTSKIVPLEDEKSLPFALNKRLNRFRQFFQKEQDTKTVLTFDRNAEEHVRDSQRQSNVPELNCPSVNARQRVQNQKFPKTSRVKRRIDFSNSPEKFERTGEHGKSLSESSTSGAHQNSTFHSTNYEEYDSSNHGKACPKESLTYGMCQNRRGRHQSTNSNVTSNIETRCKDEDDYCVRYDGQKDIASLSPQNSFFDRILSQDSDCSSFRIQSNNNNNYEQAISSPYGEKQKNEARKETEGRNVFEKGVPSVIEQERFRRSLENAASMVFHSRTGLPLTSSPAPLRRGSCCFDFDSSLNSVSSKRSALFELNTPPSPGAVSLEETDRETENAGEGEETPKRRSTSRNRPQSHALLGSFEESALNGRLEPVSTIHGFTAELGASGSFCPKHRKLPVTVFFYTLGDNDKVSTPYLAHINLGKKGYQVPRSGTIQVTLLNPLGTVVKMFVVLYDLTDMPPRSHTFLRQRTLRDKTLRYLVHLRFMSGKSGRIYLHTDIRMIICRKSDADTASDFGSESSKELRSYIHGPTNPKFSPRC